MKNIINGFVKFIFVTLVFVTQFANATLIQTGNTSTSCGSSAITNVTNAQYLGCSGAFSGNDATSNISNSASVALMDFSSTLLYSGTWGYDSANKSDTAGYGIFTSNPGTNNGSLSLDTSLEGLFAVSIKAGNYFSLFFFDGDTTGALSFDYTTHGVGIVGNGRAAALSHASYFSFTNNVQQVSIGVFSVSTPATLLMMFLSATWMMRRKIKMTRY